MRFLPVLAILALLVAAGCGDDGDDVNSSGSGDGNGSDQTQPSVDDTLDGTTFVVTGVTEDGKDYPLVPGTEIRLEFADGTLAADAGCNHLAGTYEVKDETLTVSGLQGTEMGCDEDRMAQDQWLGEVLGRGSAIAIEDDVVTLTSGGTVLTLTDREKVSPDLPLVGTKWTLDSLIEGTDESGSASSIPADVVATITFGDDGRYQLSAGCNTGGGSYTAADATAAQGSLDIGPAALTRKACDDATMSVEAAVVTVLQGEVAYEIDERSLTLTLDDKGLGFKGEP